MSKKVVVVGSGPSGMHFSLTALQKGYEVIMLDVGKPKPQAVNPWDGLAGLKEHLEDPVDYFLGKGFDSVIYPGTKGEYYGFPPSKQYVFSPISQYRLKSSGFSPLASFASGGLAEAWTGGVYPFNDTDLAEFPFTYNDIEPGYSEVARRIGVSGVQDDLEQLMPIHRFLQPPLNLDEHSSSLLRKYEKKKEMFNRRLGCIMGRARLATATENIEARQACSYLGRCLWGCPQDSFYTPSLTLRDCQQFDSFHYIPDQYVHYFKVSLQGKVSHLVTQNLKTNSIEEMEIESLVLAAGTLSTSRIFLEAIRKQTGKTVKLSGLMDNQQILVPFVSVDQIGKSFSNDTYQYHQIALGIESPQHTHPIHGLITTLKSALVHPLIHRMPCDLRSAIFLFRNLHAALGMVNVNLSDDRREENLLTLEVDEETNETKLRIDYKPGKQHESRISEAVGVVKKILRNLGGVVPPGMVHVRPMGASVHYAGTLPMSTRPQPLHVSPDCQSYDFNNLYIADGSTFPFLPAKNITFSLMANAVRVANAYCH